MQADIEADLIGELDRAHRHAELLRRRHRWSLGAALVEHHDGFHHVRHQRAVDEKARRAFDRRRQPVDAAEERVRSGEHVRLDAVVAHHFDELHARHRIEEVQADETIGPLQTCRAALPAECSTCWWRGSRPGASSARSPHRPLLEVEHLRHRLDHKIGGAHASPVNIGDEPVERVADIGRLYARSFERLAARLIAPASGSGFMSARRHRKPCHAHHAAMSPPMAPAPMTCTRWPRQFAVGQGLELLAQKEHPHQILRGVAADQPARTTRSPPAAYRSRRRRDFPTGRSAHAAPDSARWRLLRGFARACAWRRACAPASC